MSQVKIVYTHDKVEQARTQAVLDSIAARPRHPNNNNEPAAEPRQQLSIKIQAIREPPRILLDDEEEEEEASGSCFVPPPVFSPPPLPPLPAVSSSPPIPSTTPEDMPTRRYETMQQQPASRKSVPKQALHPRAAAYLPPSRSSSITTRVDPDFPESIGGAKALAPPVPQVAGLGPRIRPRVQRAGTTGLLRSRVVDKPTIPITAMTTTSIVPLSERLHQRVKHAKVAPPCVYDSPPSSPRGAEAADAVESTLLGTPLRTRMMRNSLSSTKTGKPSRYGNNVTAMEQSFRASKSKAQAMLADLSRADKDHTGLEVTALNIESRDDMFIVFRAVAIRVDTLPANEPFDCMVSLHPFEDADNDSFLRCLGHMDSEQASRASFPLKLSVFRPWRLIRSNDAAPMLLCCGLVKVNN